MISVAAYVVFCLAVYIVVDLVIDIHTYNDSVWLCKCVLAFAVLPAVFTLFFLNKLDVFSSWYSYIIYPLLFYLFYFGSAYFTALNLDLIIGYYTKNKQIEVLPVKKITKVFAGRAGFVHTDIQVAYNDDNLILQGTRSGYYLLQGVSQIEVKITRSYLGNYVGVLRHPTSNQRWNARWSYFKDWLYRYSILVPVFILIIAGGYFWKKAFYGIKKKLGGISSKYSKLIKSLLIGICIIGISFILLILILGVLP
ncbi:MAG: hypothetical protein EOO93_10870 [Pedobacter sp.]|nr:MAG: hypothetical protein EOO93_10870 [Pedobacter sp.]